MRMSECPKPQRNPARRVVTRWLLPGVLLLIVATVIVVGWGNHRPIATIRLPDGTDFSISELSNDAHYSWPPKRTDELLIDQLNRFTSKASLPQFVSLWPTKQIGHSALSSDGWMAIDWDQDSQSSPETRPKWMVITDSNGWRFLRTVPTGDKSKPEGTIISLPRMPAKTKLQLALLTADGRPLGETQLNWQRPPRTLGFVNPKSFPTPLPDTQTYGDLSVTLKHAALEPAATDDVPDEIRLTGSSCAAIRSETEILWKGERSKDWIIFDDLRGDTAVFWWRQKPFCITTPYGRVKMNMFCVCQNIEEITPRAYVRFPSADIADRRAATPDSGEAPVRLIASAAANRELVADFSGLTVYEALNGRRSLKTIVGNKASGFIDVTVEHPITDEPADATSVPLLPAQVHIELKSQRPVALFAADRDSFSHELIYCVLAHDESGHRIAGYQYCDSGTGLIFWFPRDSGACPANLAFTIIRQTTPTIQFRIALPEPVDMQHREQ
jgi:hypothetical protein